MSLLSVYEILRIAVTISHGTVQSIQIYNKSKIALANLGNMRDR